MANTPARSAQPSDKPAYVPPRVMRLGDLNEGVGACTAGSGPGLPAPVTCMADGGTADAVCSGNGQDATGGFCTGTGQTATGICNGDGSTVM